MNMPTPKTGRTERPGFSVVELLVVLGVVSLLIAITLPAFSASRQSGDRIACFAQLRDAGIGLATYANDFNDTWPSPMEHDPGTGVWGARFRGRLYPQSHQPSPQDYLVVEGMWHVPLLGRIYEDSDFIEPLVCPADTVSTPPTTGGPPLREILPPVSSSMSLAVYLDPTVLHGDGPLDGVMKMRTTSVHDMRHPSRKATLHETRPWHTPEGYIAGVPQDGLRSHTVLAGDGSVSLRAKADALSGVMFTNLHDGSWDPGITDLGRRAITVFRTTRDGVLGRDW
jgi:prepilin-type N-terminal cleavage/methylation domain-containing protein